MPSRWLCVIIVIFWFTITAWLVWTDVWPNFEAGVPPPFTVDMEEEAAAEHLKTTWYVARNGDEVLIAYTWVKYERSDDSFTFHLELRPRDLAKERAIFAGLVRLEKMDSVYRVGRRGDLRGVSVDAAFEPKVRGLATRVAYKLTGEVRDGFFQPNLNYTSLALSGELRLAPVPVSHHGTVLLPMHPVQRIEGLRRGQTWRMPMLNVVEASLNAGEPVVYLNARVLPETRSLALDGKAYDCLVVEYRGDNHRASTWIDERTGLVLRQEQTLAGDNWTMQRVAGPK